MKVSILYEEETSFLEVSRELRRPCDNERFVSRHARRKRESALCRCSIPPDPWADKIRGRVCAELKVYRSAGGRDRSRQEIHLGRFRAGLGWGTSPERKAVSRVCCQPRPSGSRPHGDGDQEQTDAALCGLRDCLDAPP